MNEGAHDIGVNSTQQDVNKKNGNNNDNNSNNNNNKRKRNDDNTHDASSNNNNKKRRNKKKQARNNKNNNSNNNSNNNRNKPQNNKKSKHKKRNWIEDCSDSIHRIPSNCAAPLTCVITRVELDEEPLLPGLVAMTCEKVNGHTDAEILTHSASKKSNNNESIIAKEDSKSGNYSNNNDDDDDNDELVVDTVPWKVATTMKADNGEVKKLFIPVMRHSSTVGPTKWQQNRKKANQQHQYVHLPNGDNGDGIKNPYLKKAVPDKFWAQRKRLFSRYDEGINIGGEGDPEMWYSVTPESIANHVANRMVAMICQSRNGCAVNEEGHEQLVRKNVDDAGDALKKDNGVQNNKDSCDKHIVIIDLFCGCGGNSIAFARMNNNNASEPVWNGASPTDRSVKVVAIDNNLSRLKMAANNASVYGIESKNIVFVHADAIDVLNHYSKGSKRSTCKGGRSDTAAEKKSAPEIQICSGYNVGGLELLPDTVDGIFLSPPWGGLSYGNVGSSGFDPISSITIKSGLGEAQLPQQHCQENAITKLGIDEKQASSATINGGELLTRAAKAVFNHDTGVVTYFLPRNTNGISIGQIAVTSGIEGHFEMEQNVVNGKVKTITAYFGNCHEKLLL